MTKNLLNEEIIRIQEMMGVQPKELTLISEQWAAIGRLFSNIPKQSGSIAKGIVKELIPGMGAFSRAIKGQLDDAVEALVIAARNGDEVGALTALKTITNLDEVGEGIAKGIATKMVDDASTGSIRNMLENLATRAKEANPNILDEDVVKLLNNQIDEVFGEFPTLAGQLKNQLTPVIEWSGKGVKKVVITTDQIMNKLKLMNSADFNNVMTRFPKFAETLRATIDNMIQGGAKSLDEMEEIALAELKKKMKPTTWERFQKLYKRHLLTADGGLNMKGKAGLIVLSLILAGGLPGILEKIGSILWPKDDRDVIEKLEDFKDEYLTPDRDEESDDSKTEKKDECPGEGAFKSYIESQGLDSSDATFNSSTCTGTVAGLDFKWNSSTSTWE